MNRIEITIPSKHFIGESHSYRGCLLSDGNVETYRPITTKSKFVKHDPYIISDIYSTGLEDLLADFPKLTIKCISIDNVEIKQPRKTFGDAEYGLFASFVIPFCVASLREQSIIAGLTVGLWFFGLISVLCIISAVIQWIKK